MLLFSECIKVITQLNVKSFIAVQFFWSDHYKREKAIIYLVLGLLCHLDDACTSNPCHADAICDTSPINGSYTCSCASGYKGIDCSEDIDECEQGM